MTGRPFFRSLIRSFNAFLFDCILFIIQIPLFTVVVRFFLRIFNPRKDVLIALRGYKMYANTVDRIVAMLFWKFSNCEDPGRRLIKSYVREGMCVVDVGANIGYHTLQLRGVLG